MFLVSEAGKTVDNRRTRRMEGKAITGLCIYIYIYVHGQRRILNRDEWIAESWPFNGLYLFINGIRSPDKLLKYTDKINENCFSCQSYIFFCSCDPSRHTCQAVQTVPTVAKATWLHQIHTPDPIFWAMKKQRNSDESSCSLCSLSLSAGPDWLSELVLLLQVWAL